MERIVKNGKGWRLGWDPKASEYQVLVGADSWAIELTEVEWQEFCRLLGQLMESMSQMADMLMDEEKISCEAESDLLWIEVEGYPDSYNLHFILSQGRRCEGKWPAAVVPDLIREIQAIALF